MTENPIVLRDVRKSYDRKPVLTGVDLEIPPGSVVGLLGRNGAGKSTMIKCLLGMIRADRGELRVFGQDSWHLDGDAKARLGFVAQDVELYPWFTVRETLDYVGSFYRMWNATFAVDTARAWDLDLDQKCGTLSRGQVQRLGIVLALGHEPELLVLDEPAASLDPSARRHFLSTVLDRVVEIGQTVLFSTHITSDVERSADRVAVLRDGRIEVFEELDTLKESTKRIRLVSKHDLPRDLEVAGALTVRVKGNEAMISMTKQDDDLIARLESDWHARAEIQDLNLEEIFLELHHG